MLKKKFFLQRFSKILNRFLDNIAAGKPSLPLHLEERIAILPSKNSPSRAENFRSKITGIAIITRPKHQSQYLLEKLKQMGINCINIPTIEICPLADKFIQAAVIQLPAQVEICIFTSANAVHAAHKHLKAYNMSTICAIGTGTQSALAQYGLSAIIPQNGQFNSEGLLAIPALQSVKDQRIAIFSGKDSRGLLLKILKERGATVWEIAVYERKIPKLSDFLLPDVPIDLIISTSGESLNNLLRLAGEKRPLLLNVPLLVISLNMQKKAISLGFKHPPLLAKNASDDAILEAIALYT